jgi:CRISPR-associated protein Cas1
MPISERVSFLYFERAIIERDGHSLVSISGPERIQIPIGRTSVLMLGPGTSMTHAAASLCALEGVLTMWVGEAGVRLYSTGNQRSDGAAILLQSRLHLDEVLRMETARRLYHLMFDEPAPQRRSIEQLRGIEGSRVKMIYENLSMQFGLKWEGRTLDLKDPLNAAISTATSALYGITEAAILALGFSPSIGFVHNGDPRSFVFDVADTVKFKTVVPLAFKVVSSSTNLVEQRTRAACRDLFYEQRMPDKIVNNILAIIDANALN